MTETNAALFNTIPSKNYFHLRKENQADYAKVRELLNFKVDDIAKATKTPKQKIRFDQKMPEQLKTIMEEWATAIQLVADFFNGNLEKTVLWFKTPNYLLGNISPRDMIRLGKYHKLLFMIQSSLNQNEAK